MIFESLELVRKELSDYFEAREVDNEVVLGNIALMEGENAIDVADKLVVSVVNIEEERALKNIQSFQRNPVLNSIEYQNPPIHLNLYVLFSANDKNYSKALKSLSTVITFFQKKRIFTLQTSTGPVPVIGDPEDNPELLDIRLIFNIYTMTFEQLNHLWGSLGGKQVPCVMYRVWLVQLQDKQLTQAGPLIEEIQSKEQIY